MCGDGRVSGIIRENKRSSFRYPFLISSGLLGYGLKLPSLRLKSVEGSLANEGEALL
ncbi:hypothetical protein LptCag_2680 [Leptospirillum ferriphilum]|uniref:Uncharacterized protein n=1 Tax=Leptospirillum ferriphilum TaxID=178606 RepID=A0A094X263_9BACT|nr:hypothetical protein LptCag_2680 [Leptospirillum ferriphilum]